MTNTTIQAMIIPIEPTNFLQQAASFPVVDVRSPGEFAHGHIPGAVNIPLFDDAERALVGTLYVRNGQEEAIRKGFELALPKTGWYIDSLRKSVKSDRILLHCWRGGMRSAAMADVFSGSGYSVYLLTGGYKAYRRFIREGLASRAKVFVLGGYTGSGKTELLKAIESMGEQVVDLEGLACHKGSVFGALGQPGQPTNEQFENNLYTTWSALDLSRIVWMEDESRMIGRVTLPDPVVEHLSAGTLLKVRLDLPIRIKRLVDEYSLFDRKLLEEAILRISERLGGTRTKEAVSALEEQQFEKVAAIALSYYDQAYQFSMARRKSKAIREIAITGENVEADAAKIIDFAYKNM
ncbi:MAG: tRNA 2-selenouridine(34) synthase MnmH [Bacteroidales bacterium]